MIALLATIIIEGTAPDSLGCPPAALARETQTWHALVARTGQHQALEVLPGGLLLFKLTVPAADTFAVRVWGENSAGYGCETVLTATASSCPCWEAP